jgi:hypothetical protein
MANATRSAPKARGEGDYLAIVVDLLVTLTVP